MIQRNLEERYTRFRTVLNILSQRDLSLKGKITILKSLAVPQLLYVTNVLHVSDKVLAEIDKDMSNFLWNGKPPKIKHDTIIADIERGGLKMPHFKTMFKSQKIIWIKRLLKKESTNWQTIAWDLLNISKDKLLSKLSLNLIGTRIQSVFYQQILELWYSLYSVAPKANMVHEECLWNKKYILIDHKPVIYKQWLKVGIKKIHDLYDGGELLHYETLGQKFKMRIDIMQ